ncbi:hypothetical protein RB4933 [Rhodopirellula baltica SH 1]|uniref:Uncharacterized protein n=1 Tax=Rhodopirellula baltica (strain DSM 10527 / NCIMB 13988 / SH1) TaxID=243090 RepID=Q7UGZ3_RHOBA|nr:hypothetical protein RB4933 [Rhodopirellula baltica SH 1]
MQTVARACFEPPVERRKDSRRRPRNKMGSVSISMPMDRLRSRARRLAA